MALAMLAERLVGHEALPTLGALIGPLTRVYAPVDDES